MAHDRTPFPWRLLGELLVERDLASAQEIADALAVQRQTGRRLGEILVARGVVTGDELVAVLAQQYGFELPERVEASAPDDTELPTPSWQPLGRLLVAQGSIAQETLDEALRTQRATGRRLGDVLVGDHGVSMLELASALAEQQGVRLGDGGARRESAGTTDDAYEVVADASVLFTTDSFLEAADFAFEYLEAKQIDALAIVRVQNGERESVWRYDAASGSRAQATVDVFGFHPTAWTGPPSYTRGG